VSAEGDVAAFLAARLDEDEAAAKAWLPLGKPDAAARANAAARYDPARVLREVEAKRNRLQRYLEQPGWDLPEGVQDGRDPDEAEADEAVKAALGYEVREDAAVYSDHPDYQAGWKP
jgi:hypothetical protein